MNKKNLLIAALAALMLAFLGATVYYFTRQSDQALQTIEQDHAQPEIMQDLESHESDEQESDEQENEHGHALGFSTLEHEHDNVELMVQGSIPAWLNGMLLRTGPALFESDSETADRWFDGCAMIHKFTIENGSVFYSNKFIQSDYLDQVKTTGKLGMKKEKKSSSLFGKLGSLMSSGSAPKYDNVNTHVCCIGGQFCAVTETPHYISFDPHTLQEHDIFCFNDKLDSHYACAHPHIDDKTGDIYNYNIQFGNTSTYIIYKIPAGTKERVPLAKINVGYPSYMHSFAMTEHYIILTEAPFRINPLDLLLTDKSFFEAFVWKPKQGTKFTVIDKHSGAIVGTYTSDPFFAIHQINAFEKGNTVVLDVAMYDDPSIMYTFGLTDMRDIEKFDLPRAHPTRITIDLGAKKDGVSMRTLTQEAMEMPRINYDLYNGKPYTYVYGTHAQEHDTVTTTLIKLNVTDGTTLKWNEEDSYPGEPIFVANPQGTDEDDGVLLATALNVKTGRSFLLILDAKTMNEVARAQLDHHIPFDSHGHFYPKA